MLRAALIAALVVTVGWAAQADDAIPTTAPDHFSEAAPAESTPPPPTADTPNPETDVSAAPDAETKTDETKTEDAEPVKEAEAPKPEAVEPPKATASGGWNEDVEEAPAGSSMRFDPRVPMFTQLRPNWGIELATTLKALGDTGSIPNQGSAKLRAISLAGEYQPAFFQSLGVLSFGPQMNLYMPIPRTGLFKTAVGMWSVGGQIRYQARYFREQPLVPVVGYGMESVAYNLAAGGSGRFMIQGPILGAMVLLNFLDPGGAAEFYVNHGVTRSYAVAEFRSTEGTDGAVTFAGRTLFFGLRIEY